MKFYLRTLFSYFRTHIGLAYWEQPENTLALHVRAVDVCLANVWSKRVHTIGVYTNWPFFQIGPADEEKIS
jgi:hypothetical protein